MNIGPCNHHLALKQCLSSDQSIHPIICLVVQTNQSVRELKCITCLQFNFVSFDHRVDQSESNKKIEFVKTTGQAVMDASYG